MKLITTKNYKTTKGEKAGYLTGILHLAPASISGHNVCPMASAGCRAACLNTAGRGIMRPVQVARIAKTRKFFSDRAAFLADLDDDIAALVRKAERENLIPCVRLNGTSDILWEVFAWELMEKYPSVQFYDYTKIAKRFARQLPENYHLTFSRSEDNEAIAIQLLESGHNVAVVFSGSLPETWQGFKVVSGDDNDLRFLDPKGCVIGLSAKGKARNSNSAFIVKS